MPKAYLDIAYGAPERHQEQLSHHQAVKNWLKQNHAAYGMPVDIAELDEVGRETLISCFSVGNVSRKSEV